MQIVQRLVYLQGLDVRTEVDAEVPHILEELLRIALEHRLLSTRDGVGRSFAGRPMKDWRDWREKSMVRADSWHLAWERREWRERMKPKMWRPRVLIGLSAVGLYLGSFWSQLRWDD